MRLLERWARYRLVLLCFEDLSAGRLLVKYVTYEKKKKKTGTLPRVT